jgi:aryl-alcohol dehydrogenase-like predicted oxidoreductase
VAEIQRAEFGRTGHLSSRTIFGAAALGWMSQERADEVLEVLSDFGVNHLDTAASYGDSELRLAPLLADHRDRFFLATKTGDRTADTARASLERSLGRLGVDHVDLIQLHNLVEPEEWEVAFAPGGAVEGLARAREEGLARFIGVTGHGLRIAAMHLHSLERFDFDSVLLPYNFLVHRSDAYRADFEALVERCAERRVAVQTIKSIARRRWTDDAQPHFAWYEPLVDHEAIGRAVRYVFGRSSLFLNTSSDARLLRSTLEAAAAGGEPPSDDELLADVEAHDMQPLFDGAALERI